MTSHQYEPDPHQARPRTADDRLASLFPDLSEGATSRRWWHRRGRWAVAAVTALALVGAGVAVAETSGADAVSYRTATAEVRDVDSLFTSVATIEPVSQAAVGFPVSGTVATVDVAVGDTVAIGQQLATLDTESLEQTVRSKQATLDQAELVLSKALDGEDVSSLTGGGGSSMQPTSVTSSTATAASAVWTSSQGATSQTVAATQSDGATSATSASTDLASAQQAVLAAQQQVDATMLAAQQALTAAEAVCAADGTDVSSTTTTTDPADADLAACRTALEQVLTAQTAVGEAQQALADASSALDALLAQAAEDTTNGTGSSSGSGLPSGSAPSGSSGTSGSTSAQGATSSSPSSEDLIAYQKAVDAAALEVAVAQQAVAQATIVSPIEGTVVASTLEVGASVTSGSTTDYVTIQGTGGYEVTTSVGVDDVADLQVGQSASVLPDGGGSAVAGQVVSIALSGDASAATYQVVVGLEGDTSSLRNGATGTLTIVTGKATSALAVPTSAVTVDGDRHTVVVVDGETATTTTVQVGVIGDVWTEITGGLDEGATIALADLSEPLPGSATEASESTGTGATGAFPGGADFPAGGFPGGGSFRPGN